MTGFTKAEGKVWCQERPPWCPFQSCRYLASSQAAACLGALPAPEPHGDGENTHRLCLHGADDDGAWTFKLQINRSDAWAISRLLGRVFKFIGGIRGPDPN